jgi:hypothetical protein
MTSVTLLEVLLAGVRVGDWCPRLGAEPFCLRRAVVGGGLQSRAAEHGVQIIPAGCT